MYVLLWKIWRKSGSVSYLFTCNTVLSSRFRFWTWFSKKEEPLVFEQYKLPTRSETTKWTNNFGQVLIVGSGCWMSKINVHIFIFSIWRKKIRKQYQVYGCLKRLNVNLEEIAKYLLFEIDLQSSLMHFTF